MRIEVFADKNAHLDIFFKANKRFTIEDTFTKKSGKNFSSALFFNIVTQQYIQKSIVARYLGYRIIMIFFLPVPYRHPPQRYLRP